MDSLQSSPPINAINTYEPPQLAEPPVANELARGRGHFPPLDGVRGLAILLVVVHHFFFNGEPTPGSRLIGVLEAVKNVGWIGVTLFFVLSGFLISGILIDSRNQRTYFTSFYARRALRIFPLYYIFLIGVYTALPRLGAWWESPIEPMTNAWVYLLYLSNMSGLLVTGITPQILDPLWSLSVEEQIYLVWPAVIWFCPPRKLLALMIATVPAALLWRTLSLWSHRSIFFAYSMTPACVDSFGLGAIGAILIRGQVEKGKLQRWAGKVLLGSGMFVAGLGIGQGTLHFWIAPKTMLTVGLTGFSFFFAALILLLVSQPSTTRLNRAFSVSWLRAFGKYSYAIYLFHMPVGLALNRLAVARFGEQAVRTIIGQTVFLAAVLFTTYLFAIASWNLVEKPFLRLKSAFPSSGRGVPDAP